MTIGEIIKAKDKATYEKLIKIANGGNFERNNNNKKINNNIRFGIQKNKVGERGGKV